MPSGMRRRDQRILLGLALLSLAFAATQSLTGLSPDLLLAVPALLLVLPLAAGRYVGEDSLVRLASRWQAPTPRAASSARPVLRAPAVLARGGRLIAAALAERGPPAALLVR